MYTSFIQTREYAVNKTPASNAPPKPVPKGPQTFKDDEPRFPASYFAQIKSACKACGIVGMLLVIYLFVYLLNNNK